MNPMYAVKTKRENKEIFGFVNLPNWLKKRYREVYVSYHSDLYNSCCIMCRVVLEVALKEVDKKLTGRNYINSNKSLMELINGCGRFLKHKERDAMLTIYMNGNLSAHSEILPGRQEATDSFRALDILLKGILSLKVVSIQWFTEI
ncbi:DUF4145 domain-containing protein [Atribacter laminatus]|nr:DUF4145 domain-containing protein [Atribacter laminatus]